MLLDHRRFLVKERVAIVKLTDAFDIHDPDTEAKIGMAIDEPASWAAYARLVIHKRFLPTRLNVYDSESEEPVFSMVKRPGFLRVELTLVDASGASFGTLRSKLFRIGGGFDVYDSGGSLVAQVKGDWKGWNFRFVTESGREIGQVTKKWVGLGKELFTSADNYMISLEGSSSTESSQEQAALLLGAGLAIDTVFKEA